MDGEIAMDTDVTIDGEVEAVMDIEVGEVINFQPSLSFIL